jgi:hypothetical protein
MGPPRAATMAVAVGPGGTGRRPRTCSMTRTAAAVAATWVSASVPWYADARSSAVL